jgi:LysM repeat protein
MTKPTYLLLLFASFFFASCGDKDGNYDTAPAAGYQQAAPPADPTYGEAAYEENSTAAPVAPVTDAAVPAATPGVAREHYVAPGDSLWKISRQYNVPIDAIKTANNMSNDTVVLGKKLIIPAQ